jgi:hypothetical protein
MDSNLKSNRDHQTRRLSAETVLIEGRKPCPLHGARHKLEGPIAMNTSLMLRIAAVLTLLYCIGHTLGIPWTPSVRVQDVAVLEAMKGDRFEFFGNTRSYWDFYYGFGLAITVYLAVQAVVLWQLAPLANALAKQIRPIVAVSFIAFVANAVITWMYFFFVPVAFAIAIAVCLALAFIMARGTHSVSTA